MLALLCLCTLFLATQALPANGQFRQVWGGEKLQIGQRTNFFAQWEGRTALDGVFLELPFGWSIKGAFALRQGYERVDLRIERVPDTQNQYMLISRRRLRGACEFVLDIETGGAPGHNTWRMVPLLQQTVRGEPRAMPQEAFRVVRPTEQVVPVLANENRVLAFRGDGPPAMLRRDALPDLSAPATYTIEFWMRTTDLEEVVMSTWDGSERSSYPLELVVDVDGRLRFFRGQPGQHESMATETPVADGQWHHVALRHDANQGWTHFFLDGMAEDSLYSAVPPSIRLDTPVALGGRLSSRDAEAAVARGYTGLLDELRFWPQSRSQDELVRTMREPEVTGEGVVQLGFEENIQSFLEGRPPTRIERVFSDLDFYYPVRSVLAVPEGESVLLTWETRDRHTEVFIVERSADGRTFEPIQEVQATQHQERRGDVSMFEYHDEDVSGKVVFYRIRQQFTSGSERLSGTIKLGLGVEEEPQGAILVDNYPNPFNASTMIRYEVKDDQRVRISVWDLAGQQIATLVDQVQSQGSYEVRFEANDLPSGTYFIRLQNPSGVQTRQMLLMK